jgi:hypothetical protein
MRKSGGIMSKDLVKKWEPTGLLGPSIHLSSDVLRQKRLQKTKQVLIAEALEECAGAMFEDFEKDKDLNSFILSLVRRIFDEGNGLKAEYQKIKKLYCKVKDSFYKELGIQDFLNIDDIEAELCALIGETYVEKYGETNKGECDDEAE